MAPPKQASTSLLSTAPQSSAPYVVVLAKDGASPVPPESDDEKIKGEKKPDAADADKKDTEKPAAKADETRRRMHPRMQAKRDPPSRSRSKSTLRRSAIAFSPSRSQRATTRALPQEKPAFSISPKLRPLAVQAARGAIPKFAQSGVSPSRSASPNKSSPIWITFRSPSMAPRFSTAQRRLDHCLG